MVLALCLALTLGPARPLRALDSSPSARAGVTAEALFTAASATAPAPDLGGELPGEVMARRKVALAFKVTGRLQCVELFAGQMASEGAPIAALDARDFELAVAQAEAALEVGRLRQRQLETGSRPEERRAAAENLEQARANRDNAKSDLDRTRDLCAAGAVSRQALDAAEARARVTEAQFLAAVQQRALVDLGPRAEEKASARVSVRQLEAALNLARLQLEYATLRAPFPGVVAQRLLDEGAFVNPSTPVYHLSQLDPIFVATDIPERILPRLEPGMPASITVDALPGREFAASVGRIPGVLDPRTRTARLELELPNPGLLLKPGMFARVRLGSLPR